MPSKEATLPPAIHSTLPRHRLPAALPAACKPSPSTLGHALVTEVMGQRSPGATLYPALGNASHRAHPPQGGSNA